ncbi:MAG: EAL domain-containing protein [Treponema sp.]|nr:EAL domain-containing protein [Treponema sp.]
MPRIITFDICSIIILIILISSLFLRKMIRGRSNVIFLILAITVFFSGIFDILRIYCPLHLVPSTSSRVVIYIFNYLYLLLRNLSTPIYILFIYSVCGMWHDFNNDMLLKIIWGLPVACILGMLIVDIYFHQIFVIDENLMYVRGKWIKYMRIAAIWLLAYSIICLIYNMNMISKKKLYLLLLLCPINVIGVLIQSYWPNYMVEVMCTTFPLVFISLAVQKPEEIMDMNSGSMNMHAFREEMSRNFAAKRNSFLCMVKIIDFDKLHNQLGKQNINYFLYHLTKVFYSICNDDEYDVFHLGDGCFVILTLRDDVEKNEGIAVKVKDFLTGRHEIHKINIMFDSKICYIRCPQDLTTYESLINFQKNLMQIIQEKNTVVYLSDISDSRDFQIHHQIDHIISQGIKNSSFEMYYQPIYSIQKKQFVSAEALIRLKDDNLGFVSPAIFIPAAEKNGAIHQIGDFVLEDVISFISQNSIEKYGLEYIELNLSMAQCIESNLSDKVMSLLEKYTVSPQKINLEITETSENVNYDVIERNINNLSSKGVSFSLDDFGTGYSNILRITKLPLNIIKLDKSFVDDLNKPGMKTIISETVSMLKKMNKKLLIEGVETYEDFDYFRNIGCDYIQGYYFSRPLTKTDFFEFLKNSNEGPESINSVMAYSSSGGSAV